MLKHGDYLVWQIDNTSKGLIRYVACHEDHQGCGCPQMGAGTTHEEAIADAIKNAAEFLGVLDKLSAIGLHPMDISGQPL